MPSQHNFWRECSYAACVVAVLLAIYSGAYYGTVTPETIMTSGDPGLGLGSFSLVTVKRPRYSLAQAPLESFFGPMHAIDRRLRPDVWRGENFAGESNVRGLRPLK
jgi:hypothetical protein